MKGVLFGAMLGVVAVLGLHAQATTGYLGLSDRYSFEDKNQASIDLLMKTLPAVTGAKAQAEIYWRLSRDTLHLADDLRSAGAASSEKLLAMYQKGEGYADEAISLDPNGAEGYYWKASNIGRWGQVRGILASLFKADPMRKLLFASATLDPSRGDPWFVLGQLYEQVPGFPISFGNTAWAVSLGRKAIDARKVEVRRGAMPDVPEDYYVQLANHLAKRNWSAAKRRREHPAEVQKYADTSNVVEKNFYYEGAVSIPNESDRQEATSLVREVIDRLLAVANRNGTQERDLKHAKEDLADWSR